MENKKVAILIPLLTAILAFAGAVGGTFVSAYFNNHLWYEQIIFKQDMEIFNTRVDLIKKVTTIANQAPTMKGYQSYLNLQAALAKNYIKCKKNKSIDCIQPDGPKSVLGVNSKRAELNAKFATTLELVSLYFGPDSKKIAKKLAKLQPWWEIGTPEFKTLLNTMQSELYLNIPHNKKMKADD